MLRVLSNFALFVYQINYFELSGVAPPVHSSQQQKKRMIIVLRGRETDFVLLTHD